MSRGSRGARPSWMLWVVLAAAVVLSVVLLGGGGTVPYDLDSTEPSGYRALALLLESFGGRIHRVDAGDVVAGSAATGPVVYIPTPSGGSREQVESWRAFARAGGTLVLGQPVDGLGAAGSDPSGGLSGSEGRDCTIARLRDITGVVPPPNDEALDAGDGQWCYGSPDDALVVLEREGAGTVVTLASPDLFTNQSLGAPAKDEKVAPAELLPANGLVAQELLAPDGATDVDVVTGGVASLPTGKKTATDFMSPGVKLGLAELLAAFGFYAWFRARRHGRLIHEPQPVSIAASELVEAVGNLRERRGDPAPTAGQIRVQARRDLARSFGLPANAPLSDVAALVAERTGRDVAEIARALGDDGVHSDAELLALVRILDTIRQEALHV